MLLVKTQFKKRVQVQVQKGVKKQFKNRVKNYDSRGYGAFGQENSGR